MSRRQRFYCAFWIAVAIFVTSFCYRNFEWQTHETNLGMQQAAYANPYLAAEQLFASAQANQQAPIFKVFYHYNLLFSSLPNAVMPATDDLLILANSYRQLNNQQVEQILAWVDAGGHLLLSLETAYEIQGRDIRHPLWQAFNITTYPTVYPDTTVACEPTTEAKAEDNEACNASDNQPVEPDKDHHENSDVNLTQDDDDTLLTPFTDANGYTYKVSLEPSYRIRANKDTLLSRAGDENGDTFVQFSWGKGQVSLLTEVEIWSNFQLRNDDNAYLLKQFVDGTAHTYLFSQNERLTWWEKFYLWSPWLVYSLFMLLITSLIYLASRFGQVQTQSEQHQHFFRQHIEAAGQYYWKIESQRQSGQAHEPMTSPLLTVLRQDIEQVLTQRWPNFAHYTKQEKLTLLAELTKWPTNTVENILFAHTKSNEVHFTQVVKGLQKLRKML